MSRGILYGTAAYVLWGLTPLFWNAIQGVTPIEMLSHRVLWAVPLLLVVIATGRGWSRLRGVYHDPRAWRLAAAAGALLAVNWGTFLWAVTNGHIVESSLGYYINPLVSVVLGVVVLRESLRPAAWASVGIAAAGVSVMTISLGVLPWIALALAFSFGFYGLLKKRPGAAPPVESLLGETVTVAVPFGLFLAMRFAGDHHASDLPLATWALLALSGVVTVVPLLLFGASAQRIPLTTLGLLQYLAPSIQLGVGLMVFDETLSGGQLVGFMLVWLALAVLAFDSLRMARSRTDFPS